jgi:outer membrane receptor protein involved in Fe transport
VEPQLQPTTVDELLAGGEYEVVDDTRVGAVFAKRTLVAALREMSLDGGLTDIIGNPGVGLGQAFNLARRDYLAVTGYVNRTFARQWTALASYTWSELLGNDPGGFEPQSMLRNGSGPLPQDHTHTIKALGGYELSIATSRLAFGLSYLGQSGGPTSVLASDEHFGDGAIFLLPRGSGPRLPWVHRLDAHVSFELPLGPASRLQLTADAFNLFNFQAITAVDERYTLADAAPLAPGTPLSSLAQAPNPNFGQPIARQMPRTIRVGARVEF